MTSAIIDTIIKGARACETHEVEVDPHLATIAIRAIDDHNVDLDAVKAAISGQLRPHMNGGNTRAEIEWMLAGGDAAVQHFASQPAPEVHRANILTSFSEQLANLDRELREQINTAAEVALREAFKRLGITARANYDEKTKELYAADGFDAYLTIRANRTPELIRAMADPDEVFAKVFDDLAGDACRFIERTRKSAARIWAQQLGLPVAAATAALPEFNCKDDESVRYLVDSMTNLANGRLSQDDPLEFIVQNGERPRSTVPPNIVTNTVGRAGGLQGNTAGLVDGVGAFVTNGGTQTLQMGVAQSSELLARLLDDNPTAPRLQVQTRWNHGSPEVDFDPHLALHDFVWPDVAAYEADAQRVNGGSFPLTPRFFPGDHLGCTCTLVTEYVEVES